MSTARQADRPAPASPTVTRTSIFPKGACPSPTATIPAVSLPATSFAGWRDRTPTEELEAVPHGDVARAERAPSSCPARRLTVAQHLRCAVAGTLLAIVAITGLSSYAAQGIADARSAALCQAHISCK